MQIKPVALLVAILFTSTLAQMQKTNNKSNKGSYTDLTFNGGDDINMLLDYQLMINNLRNVTTNTLRSVGYEVSLVKATLKAAVAAKRAIKMCYTTRPSEEFHTCANEEIEKTRLQIEATPPVEEKNAETTESAKTKVMKTFFKVLGGLTIWG